MKTFDWWYDDLKQVGLDFEDEAQVATYDARQNSSADRDAALLKELGLTAGMAMADIGCGTGVMVCEAARMCRSAVGVDVSAAMLRSAQARATRLGCENLTFQRAGFLSFALAPASFDLITTKSALHHLPDFWKAIAIVRMREALKPGGRLYIQDVAFNCPPGELIAAAEAWIDWLGRETLYSREEGACHIREEHSTFGWILERMLTDAGFTLLRREHEGPYARFLAERGG
ncbi:class I SAM-dependent methyltransferase [Phenylobacterium sp.]|jgi:ubiquinone/menaquinone biosynthesis C-methylase UbiE|uniref:class I SAM-dependent methyltransferase n=1 Tax=Phenylobacterium sp. TaxID=1871053 RepID=UPI002E371AEC|nr:methyltransferase domain-containing protein [Phenylobacterium sp.]HEX2561934.1 methyltransferase domain-containing protein [Phenylobacterium sp.]